MTPDLHKLFTFLSFLDNVYEWHNVHGNAKLCHQNWVTVYFSIEYHSFDTFHICDTMVHVYMPMPYKYIRGKNICKIVVRCKCLH